MTEQNRSSCKIKEKVHIVCPKCSGMIAIPMAQAVNGQKITCSKCQHDFFFRDVKSSK